MIFVGDIASPGISTSGQLENIFAAHAAVFNGQALVCNFEGLVCDDISPDTKTPVLYNHSSVLPVLKKANLKMAALANNHTNDLPGYFDGTINKLNEYGISFAGAARSKEQALQPVSFFDGDTEILLFNACWDFLLYHQKNPAAGVHVAEMDALLLIREVSKAAKQKPAAKIVVFLHWSLDLEILPYPMYRQMAMDMIDAGAGAVLGAHSHCVQGGEKYKDGYIVYGLGNFFLPHHIYANGTLAFPEFSRTELAFEWHPVTNKATCHWFYYDDSNGNQQLILKESAPFESSQVLKQFTAFAQMPLQEYIGYFKANRRKKFLIPVYEDYKAVFKNAVLTFLLKGRGRFARLLAKYKIIKWQT
jgi:Bacterial capsule synthesis protein PGA_cap